MKRKRIGIVVGLSIFIIVLFNSANQVAPVIAAPQAAILHVDVSTGADNGSCGATSQPCKTIQGAINIAADGDTIRVAKGTYQGSQACLGGIPVVVCLINRHLTILGGYTTGNWNTADPVTNPTIIDGQNARRAIQFWGIDSSSASLTIRGFTIQNGLAQGSSSGGDAETFAFGGGMIADRGLLVAQDMIFKNNTAVGGNTASAYGGAAGGGALSLRANPAGTALENIQFVDNKALGGTGLERGGFAIGGGLYTFAANLVGKNLTFTDNQTIAGNSNGDGVNGGNNADAQGGGAAFQVGSDVTLQNVVATGNQAFGGNTPNGDAGGAFGGAFFTELATVTLIDVDMRNNLAQGGDGLNNGNGASLGIGGGFSAGGATVTLERATIINNTARGGDGTVNRGAAGGGGAQFGGDVTISIANTIIADNLAEMGATGVVPGGGGGGLFIDTANVSILHSTFARNRLGSSPMQGNGIVLINGGQATITHSIIANHTSYASAIAVHAQPGNTVSLNNNLFSGNTTNTGGGGTFSGTGTIFSGAPDFVSPGSPNYDYHINSNSAAIDEAAGSTTAVDIDNQSRLSFSPPDVGADEFAPIILTATQGDGTLSLRWQVNLALLSGLDHYQIIINPASGASPPTQGTSINAGTQTSFTLTGLTNFKNYTITIEARNGTNAVIGQSNTVTTFPTDQIIYLPTVLKP